MKIRYILAFLLGSLLHINAQDQGHGLGIILGEPTGISYKLWLNERNAIDAVAAYAFNDGDLHLHSDYLWHQRELFGVPMDQMPLYYGVGARLKTFDDTRFGIRAPLGVSFFIPNTPLDVFAEFAPILDVAPGIRMEWTGGVGVRYWF